MAPYYFASIVIYAGIILKPDPEKGIKFYVETNFAGGFNQEEVKDSISVLSRMSYVITYANCQIIWASQLQVEIAFRTMEAEYIAVRGVLPFTILMKEI